MTCQEFRGTLAAKVQICKPADPEAKGVVERFHDYLERSFLPGRTFTDPDDFNTSWPSSLSRANQRHHRGSGVARSIASMVTGRRCWGCRRCHRSPDGGLDPARARSLSASGRQRLLRASGCDRSAGRAGRRPATGSGCSARAVWSPTTTGSGPSTKRSPTRPTVEAADQLRRDRVTVLAQPTGLAVEQRRLWTTTWLSASSAESTMVPLTRPWWSGVVSPSAAGPQTLLRVGVLDPGVEGADIA